MKIILILTFLLTYNLVNAQTAKNEEYQKRKESILKETDKCFNCHPKTSHAEPIDNDPCNQRKPSTMAQCECRMEKLRITKLNDLEAWYKSAKTNQTQNNNSNRDATESYKTQQEDRRSAEIERLQSKAQNNKQIFQNVQEKVLSLVDKLEADKLDREATQEQREVDQAYERLERDVASGNYELKKCANCNSSGKEQCDDCAGQGKIRCNICGGSGKFGDNNCSSCSGTGEKACYKCYTRGFIRCYTCDGTGYTKIFIKTISPQNVVINENTNSQPDDNRLFTKSNYMSSNYRDDLVQEIKNIPQFDIFKEFVSSPDFKKEYNFDDPIKKITLFDNKTEIIKELEKNINISTMKMLYEVCGFQQLEYNKEVIKTYINIENGRLHLTSEYIEIGYQQAYESVSSHYFGQKAIRKYSIDLKDIKKIKLENIELKAKCFKQFYGDPIYNIVFYVKPYITEFLADAFSIESNGEPLRTGISNQLKQDGMVFKFEVKNKIVGTQIASLINDLIVQLK